MKNQTDMIKHIVFIKIKSEFTEEVKSQVCHELKNKLDVLPEMIEEIKFYETGINVSNAPNAFDVALISDFESLETLHAYRIHPEHVKILNFIDEVKEDVKVVDYEF